MGRNYPSKLYYSISEVASIAEVKAHVLRYWETEFPTLKPKKARNGSRRYRKKDIEEVFEIKELLYDKGYKIAGAKKLRQDSKVAARQKSEQEIPQLAIAFDSLSEGDKFEFLKTELIEIKKMLAEMSTEKKAAAAAENPAPVALKSMKAEG